MLDTINTMHRFRVESKSKSMKMDSGLYSYHGSTTYPAYLHYQGHLFLFEKVKKIKIFFNLSEKHLSGHLLIQR